VKKGLKQELIMFIALGKCTLNGSGGKSWHNLKISIKKLVVGVPRNKMLTLSKNPFEFYLVTFFNLDCIDCNTTIFGTQYDYGKSIWLKYDLTFGTRKTTKYKKK